MFGILFRFQWMLILLAFLLQKTILCSNLLTIYELSANNVYNCLYHFLPSPFFLLSKNFPKNNTKNLRRKYGLDSAVVGENLGPKNQV